MQKNLNDYEVTIEGIGLRPYVDLFTAPSPGLAKLAAQDRFGRWIKVTDVKAINKKLQLPRVLPTKRRKRRKTSASN